MPIEEIIRDDFQTAEDRFARRQRARRRREDPSAEDDAERESDNKRRRDEVRRKIADVKLQEERCERIRQAQAEVGLRKEQLAAEHVAKCAPWQAELADIDKQAIDAILSKAPRDDALEARRAELLALIRQANVDLETAIENQDRLLGELKLEFKRTAATETVGTLEMDLLRLAPPKLRLRVQVLSGACERAQKYANHVYQSQRLPPELHTVAIEFATEEVARLVAFRDKAFREAVEY